MMMMMMMMMIVMYYTHRRHTSMLPEGFEPAIPVSEGRRPMP